MQNIARAALLLELFVSWMVWSHHLLADQSQPNLLKLLSGEMVTAFELVTQGIAIFITLVTLWSAKPLIMDNRLKFLLAGMFGFMISIPAAIFQADMGLNRILHNTQWIMFTHVHTAILIGLTMTLYAAIYTLWPLLTNNVKLYSQKLASWHFWLHLLGTLGMSFFMGMAAMNGALRRYIYVDGEYTIYMIFAAISGMAVFIAWLLYLYNIIMSFGLKGVIGIYRPSKIDTRDLMPSEPGNS